MMRTFLVFVVCVQLSGHLIFALNTVPGLINVSCRVCVSGQIQIRTTLLVEPVGAFNTARSQPNRE